MHKRKNPSLVGKVKQNEAKYNTVENTKCMTLNMWIDMENKNNHHRRVHFISNNNSSLVFTLWK